MPCPEIFTHNYPVTFKFFLARNFPMAEINRALPKKFSGLKVGIEDWLETNMEVKHQKAYELGKAVALLAEYQQTPELADRFTGSALPIDKKVFYWRVLAMGLAVSWAFMGGSFLYGMNSENLPLEAISHGLQAFSGTLKAEFICGGISGALSTLMFFSIHHNLKIYNHLRYLANLDPIK